MAWSLKDGRYFRQKQQMLEWKNEYTKGNLEVALKYVIESTPEAYRVTCGDECGGVARCGNPSVMQVKNVIRELEESGDFDVIRTPDIHGTVEFLVTVTLELQHRLVRIFLSSSVLQCYSKDHAG
uniref:Uncharacterized protein LOC102803948 n=1 Tax=Saccoglossus kowalevskii TaxID=10224 RepID=A0ABM0LZG6_SACKO|nr:PREDICTED: uncharacterized protein LOC102803948 [Saccoglossus kowalevskii]